MGFWVGFFYGVFSVGLAVFVPITIIGVLLELFFKETGNKFLRVLGIILIVIAALLLAATIGVMVYLARVFYTEWQALN